jgi:hypothetical protein
MGTVKMNNELKALRNASDKIGRVCNRLMAVVPTDATNLAPESVELVHGIYLWRFKEDKSPAYVGVALGKRGLRGRIIEQHLRPSYVQSVFRMAIVESTGVGPREESVEYIKSNFTAAFVACAEEDSATIGAAESLVVAALKPRFNKIRRNVPNHALQPTPRTARLKAYVRHTHGAIT